MGVQGDRRLWGSLLAVLEKGADANAADDASTGPCNWHTRHSIIPSSFSLNRVDNPKAQVSLVYFFPEQAEVGGGVPADTLATSVSMPLRALISSS